MDKRFLRTKTLIGESSMNALANAHVAVFGVGGVGGYSVEALARSGVGEITLVDSDIVDITNLNRQIIALSSTVGRYKTEVMAERIKDINPLCRVNLKTLFFSSETLGEFDFSTFDYIIDAIDTVTSKLLLIETARAHGTPIISSMGTGNKLDPTAFKIADITKTSVCPLARVMRRELKNRGIQHLDVLYSEETPISATISDGEKSRHAPASISFVPSAAGLIIGGYVIQGLINSASSSKAKQITPEEN